MKDIIWVGSSRKDLKGFPKEVMDEIGFSLFQVQEGKIPGNAKPFKGLGPGILEIVCDFNTNAYRAIYATKIAEEIYVLHTFQKKSKKGIKTPLKEINLIKQRLNMAKEIATAKRKVLKCIIN